MSAGGHNWRNGPWGDDAWTQDHEQASRAETQRSSVDRLPVGRLTVDVFVSPHATPDLDPEPALLAAIAGAKSRLVFGIYSLTLPAVTDAIIAKARAGLDVWGVVDHVAAASVQVQRLAAAGVDVRAWGTGWTLMHDKVLLVDADLCALGSYNWTTQAEKSNTEVLLIAHGSATGNVLIPALSAQLAVAYAAGRPVASAS